jgi:hypothetical protein
MNTKIISAEEIMCDNTMDAKMKHSLLEHLIIFHSDTPEIVNVRRALAELNYVPKSRPLRK